MAMLVNEHLKCIYIKEVNENGLHQAKYSYEKLLCLVVYADGGVISRKNHRVWLN